MDGGECYWTAKISVAGNAAYYYVSETLLSLLRQILEKGQTHFPGLLEVKNVNVEISREMLVHSPVPSHIAERSYEKIPNKEVKEAKISVSVSIPADVELTLIVEFDEEKVKGFKITRRNVLAKYEVLAIAAAKTKQKIKGAHIEGKHGKVFWVVASDDKEMRFDVKNIYMQELLEV